ncbi:MULTISPECIES: NUDIX domain-containing protein [Methylobacterium]|uniref:Nudix hydrolase domain-containing protein n=1 Tax=Methylobacterium jeotgali TaxID=381630 RepID=A0ABQ4SW65_9HYPH|nr:MULTISPECIES: NUDIX domain-containing protein [Methylobacterium]PIU08717.1 MAG: NUDIX hydrolase [Methylobacterium sp. CG09_land_8_20_14_0_10_71_15]PIU16291.1 MAG: NUDIX hydrolase [Methylobacterium sp. CG08_land_8_20_14_0_20_71_15]GBU18287.1 NUDIX hydrolase [Methylobacterium sp.]GJE05931.1 hypothetical protein AOPFMNJM_1237 [Methylobacterium jeotgali]
MEPSTDGSPAPGSATPERVRALRPRDAATLILVERSRRAPRVLMGRRNPNLVFMPGKFVFPGGRIEAVDRRMPVTGALSERTEALLRTRVTRPAQGLGRTLALAAIRETFEETGLVVGTREYGPPETAPAGAWRSFADHGAMPDLEALHLVARAITPPGRVRRYDTRFFAAERGAVAAEQPGIVGEGAELVELAWVRLDEARRLDLPGITRLILDELEEQMAGGFAPFRPLPFHIMRHGRRERVLL